MLQQIYVGLYDPNARLLMEDEPKYANLQLDRSNQWNCKRISVIDGRDAKTYVFNLNQWLLAGPEMDRRSGITARPAELRLSQRRKTDDMKSTFNNWAPRRLFTQNNVSYLLLNYVALEKSGFSIAPIKLIRHFQNSNKISQCHVFI